ncbi:MAG TPA: 2-hydroxyacid dehydrogenase [Candidatus Dormibacteraeota bacterium]|nr:2-hydroxyacid dehydrogenase [Candidatus Dormibacteraeota bacterium]
MHDEGMLVVSTSPAPPELFAGSLPPGTRVVRADHEELLALAPDADVIIGDWSHQIHVDRDVIERTTRCRLVQQPSAGYENIDVDAAREKGIPVANAGPANANAVAEHAIMGTLACLKQLREAIADAERGGWDQQRWIDKDLGDLYRRTVGILGFGAIGQAVASRLVGFDCETLYHRRNRLSAADEDRLRVTYTELDHLLRQSEVLILTLPLNPVTRGIISAERLAELPKGAIVVNVSRGGIVDERALADALRSGHLGGAALDVFSVEPLPVGHDLGSLPNVVLTPHIGGATAQSKRNILMNSIGNVSRVVRGEPPQFVVNGAEKART